MVIQAVCLSLGMQVHHTIKILGVIQRSAIIKPALLYRILLQIWITDFAALVWKTEDFAVGEWVRESGICE